MCDKPGHISRNCRSNGTLNGIAEQDNGGERQNDTRWDGPGDIHKTGRHHQQSDQPKN